MDLSTYSRQELLKLKKQVEHELDARRRIDQRSARQELKDIAEKYGMTLADLITGIGIHEKSRRPKGQMVFRHPQDPSKGWSGRGRKPKWIKEWESSGRSLDELRQQ
mgnify:CR=1 FL=1